MQPGRPGEPYGGRLTDRQLPQGKAEQLLTEAKEMLMIRPFIDFIYDAEKIGIGAYSPLEGFMDEDSVNNVLKSRRLPNGLPWTIPIILAPRSPEEELARISEGDDVAILDDTNQPFAVIHVEQKFKYDKDAFNKAVFGTTDAHHPNVNDVYSSWGETALAGKVDLIRRLKLPTGKYELTPAECRAAFNSRGWKNVVAYQCRNPPHTAHEYLQRIALEQVDVDGLLIHPVVGRLKKGDYKPDVILRSYQAAVEHYYVKERVLLASISITMRYAGPNAALFLAIVRKNYGCSHYIVGRDQAGVGNYYDPYACHRIFDELDIGIIPLRYTETFYCRRCGWMATPRTCPHPNESHITTSQTRIRSLLKEGKELPMEILRPEVADILSEGGVIIE